MNGRDGGDARFETIFRRYYARVWRYFRACRVADDEAHDLAQDAFKRLFERIGQIRNENEWPFLQSVARTVFLNWLRAQKTQKRGSAKTVDLDDPELAAKMPIAEQPDYATRQQDAVRSRQLREAIEALPNGQRQCMELWLDELSYEEISAGLRITLDAVKSRIRDARKALSARLGETLPEEEP